MTFGTDDAGFYVPNGDGLDRAWLAVRHMARALGYKNDREYTSALLHDLPTVRARLRALRPTKKKAR